MITTKKPDQLWDDILQILKPELKDETFDLWLKPLSIISREPGTFILKVPNRFFSDWIKTNYQSRIEELLTQATGLKTVLAFETQLDDPNQPLIPLSKSPIGIKSAEHVKPIKRALSNEDLRLDTRYGFDTFVVGPS